MGREAPHLSLARSDRGGQREAIPVTGLDQEPGEAVHRRTIPGNHRAFGVDYQGMKCQTARTAVSARLDGEDPGVDPRALDDHLERCVACHAFARDAASLHREARLARAPDVPDLTAPILTAIGSHGRRSAHEGALRITLVVVALVQLAVAVPALVLGDDAGTSVHAARHIGSFDLALAVGFLFAAWRPSRVAGLIPVVAALVACLVGTSVLDVLDGQAGAVTEFQHIIDVAGLAAVWLLAHPLRPRRRAHLSTP
jgi:predicted anti-sigma-YlaC factor YlaD